jgi:hypothetical protein
VLAGSFVCEFVQMYLMQYTGQLAMFDLRRQLMQHLQDLDLAFYDRNPVGRLVTRVTSDVDVLNDLFASGLVTILGDVLVLVFILGIMFSFSPVLTAIMLTAMPFVILTTAIFRRSVTESYRRIRVAIARINSYLQEHITGIVVLQLFNRERRAAPGVRRGEPPAHARLQGRHHGVRLVLPGGGVHFHAGAGRHSDLRRFPRAGRGAVAGRGGGLPAIRLALLPSHSGPEREIQHPASGDGLFGAHFQIAGYRPRGGGPAAPQPAPETIRPSSSTTCGSPTRAKTGCCAT